MYIKRKLEAVFTTYLEAREILAVIGPRQSGKTTLLQKIQAGLEDSVLLSFEDREDLELFELDIKGFAGKYSRYRYIFIDEFQYAKSGGKNLKYLYDSCADNKIIISGSSAIDLTIHALKFLVGRIFIFSLYQLDFEEYLNYRDSGLHHTFVEVKASVNIKAGSIAVPRLSPVLVKQFNRLLEEFILWGGYPRVVLATTEDEKRMILKNIYNTYFLRDIRDTLGLIDDFKLSKLLKALSLQIGQLLEYNDLSRLSGYDHITLKKYLNMLEKTFICALVRPFFRNKSNEITKNPKVYFYDTGLRNHVMGDFRGLENRADKGFLYENFIFSQLNKQELHMNFWRTKAKAEIDFIVETSNGVIPIEIKSSIGKPLIGKALHSFISAYTPESALLLNEDVLINSKVEETAVYFLPHWVI